MEEEISRESYLQKLVARKQNGLVKVITGVRRCGKSYLLNTIFYRHLISSGVKEDHILRFAFDSAEDLERMGESLISMAKEKRKADPSKFLAYIRQRTQDGGLYYLLLDEIQLLDCFESVLNGYLQQGNMDVYVTGSNAKFLSKDIITEFSGRGDEIRLYPLSFSEFMSHRGGDPREGLSEYLLYGGIPQIVLRQTAEEKEAILKRLLEEIYLSDIVKRRRIRDKGDMEDLLDFLASSIGSLTNPRKLKNAFASLKGSSISEVTIKSYLEALEDSFLIAAACRYDVKGKAYLSTPKKYYFCDLGLRNARLNFRQIEMTHALENLLYNELLIRGYSVDVGVVPLVEKNAQGHSERRALEIDFVCNKGYERLYVQSAYAIPDEAKMRQEARPFLAAPDSFQKIIVVGDMTPRHRTEEGILVVNVCDFLLHPELAAR